MNKRFKLLLVLLCALWGAHSYAADELSYDEIRDLADTADYRHLPSTMRLLRDMAEHGNAYVYQLPVFLYSDEGYRTGQNHTSHRF